MSHEKGPDLTGDFDVLGHFDSVGDDVGTVIKVDDLVFRHAIQHFLDGGGVIGLAITLGTGRLDAHKGRSGVFRVLRLGSLKHLRAIQ